MLRGAVLGLGRMGQHHARKLQARPDVALVLHDPPRGLHEALDPRRLDFAVIAAPTRLHHALALPLLRAGVACLVEKPLAAELAEAEELAAFPRLSVGHVERFNPAVRALGPTRPRFVECVRLSPWRAGAEGTRGSDVDVVGDLMVHDLDLLRGWLGPGPLRSVQAVGVELRGRGLDLVDARLEIGPSPGFPGGTATLRTSRLSPGPVRTARLFEADRYTSLDLLLGRAHQVHGADPALTPVPLDAPPGDALDAELDSFLAAVRGERPFPVPGEEALAAMRWAEEVRRACLSPSTPR